MKINHVLVREIPSITGPEGCLSEAEDLRCYSYDLFSRGQPDLVVVSQASLIEPLTAAPSNALIEEALYAMVTQHRIPFLFIGFSIGIASLLFALPTCRCLSSVFLGGVAAAGIAMINAIGSISGFVGQSFVGWIRDLTQNAISAILRVCVPRDSWWGPGFPDSHSTGQKVRPVMNLVDALVSLLKTDLHWFFHPSSKLAF